MHAFLLEMSRLGFLFVLLMVAFAPRAQTADASEANRVYELAEVQPEMVGGMAALAGAVTYPPAAWERGVEGTVIVQFVVTASGDVVDPVALRSPDEDLSQAALAAVRQQRFTPGQIAGQPVAVRVTVPIRFRLPEADPDRLAPRPIAIAPRPTPLPVVEGFEPDSAGVYGKAEVQPELIGGPETIRPHYPDDARRGGVQGRVIVQFVVDQVGELTDVEVVRSPHELLTGAALDAVRRLRFRPGTVGGQPVKVRFSLPVTFRLR